MLAAASSLLSGRAYSFQNFLPPLFLCLTPFSDYVGDQHFTNSSPLSFLNVYAPLFALFRRIAEHTPFLPPSFLYPGIFSFWGILITITPLKLKRYFRSRDEKVLNWIIFFPSITLTYLCFSTAPRAVAPPLTSPLPRPFSPILVHGRCFRT